VAGEWWQGPQGRRAQPAGLTQKGSSSSVACLRAACVPLAHRLRAACMPFARRPARWRRTHVDGGSADKEEDLGDHDLDAHHGGRGGHPVPLHGVGLTVRHRLRVRGYVCSMCACACTCMCRHQYGEHEEHEEILSPPLRRGVQDGGRVCVAATHAVGHVSLTARISQTAGLSGCMCSANRCLQLGARSARGVILTSALQSHTGLERSLAKSTFLPGAHSPERWRTWTGAAQPSQR